MVFSIQHYVTKFINDLWQVGGFLYTALCDKVYQWLVTCLWFRVSSNATHGEVYLLQHYVIKLVSDLWQVCGFLYTALCDKVYQWLLTGLWFSPGTPVSSTNETDRHDITDILLKVALSTINLNLTYKRYTNDDNIRQKLIYRNGTRSLTTVLLSPSFRPKMNWWIVI